MLKKNNQKDNASPEAEVKEIAEEETKEAEEISKEDERENKEIKKEPKENEEEAMEAEEILKNPQQIKKSFHRWMVIAGLSIFCSLILMVAVYYSITKHNAGLKNSLSVFSEKNENKEVFNLTRRNIDGVYVAKGLENLPVYSAVIDNSVDARPPKGLEYANLVIESEAEGGITRYLAFFSAGREIAIIGPIRSARPYYVDWSKEFSALLAHCGGSPEALARLAKENAIHLNEFYNENFFWRDKEIKGPHNIFTNSENLEKYLAQKKISEGNFFSWLYKDDLSLANRPEAQEIKVNYLKPIYSVSWQYDKANNTYQRYLGGELQKDGQGKIISAKNIIIQYIAAVETDSELRLKMDTIGEGKALVCLDGACREAAWKNRNPSSRTRYFIGEEEVKFNAGKTWINAVRPNYKVDRDS